MSVPVLTFFNNKGGVGKTSLVYHLSWIFSEIGYRVISIDLDPQANLTAAFLEEERLENLWEDENSDRTVYQCLKPLTGFGDIKSPTLIGIKENLFLSPGDLALAGFEDILSSAWPDSMLDKNLERPFRILTAFWQIAQSAAKSADANMIIADVGPNLGAINRSALISSDFVIIPLGADLFSLQGLKNLGPTLRSWRSLWQRRLDNWNNPSFELPQGKMLPIGYIVQQHSVRLDRPVKSYEKWVNRIPDVYRSYVLEEKAESDLIPENDPYCLAKIKHFRSLIAMAQEARKPVFTLSSADGAIGVHTQAVQEAFADFSILALNIIERTGIFSGNTV